MRRLNKIVKSLSVVSLVGALSLPSLVNSRTINVPQDYYRIQEAINAASDSDTILVGPGVYNENLLIKEKSIHLISTTLPESTEISSTKLKDEAITIIGSKNYTVDGFIITSPQGIGIYSFFSNGTISQNYISETNKAIVVQSGKSVNIWGNTLEYNNQAIISNSDSTVVSQNNIGHNGFTNHTPAVSLEGRINNAELNCFVDNRTGLRISGRYNEIFQNNFVRNTYGVNVDSTANLVLVMNNLFFHNYHTGLKFEKKQQNLNKLSIKCNGFYRNQFDSNISLGKENFFTAPKFEEREDYFMPIVKGSFYDSVNPCSSQIGAYGPLDEE